MKSDSSGDKNVQFFTNFRGRLTASQKHALHEFTGDFMLLTGHSMAKTIEDLNHPGFGVEIGFGMGLELLSWAKKSPEKLLLGVELYRPGIGSLFAQLADQEIKNVRVIEGPAQLVVSELETNSVEEIRIFFPDPWPKKKHAKRRLIQPAFVVELGRVLKEGGSIKLATDWAPYASWISECFGQSGEFELIEVNEGKTAKEPNLRRDLTKFEKKGLDLNHDIFDFSYRLKNQ